MNRILSPLLVLTTIAFALLSGCSKDEESPAVLTGTLRGSVQVWNDKTVSLTDRSGVTVTIENISGKNTSTAADGSFQFSDLPYDTYDLTFSKSGYGTRKVFGVKLSGTASGTTVNMATVQFGALSTTTVTSLAIVNATYNGGPGVTFSYSMNPVPSTSSRAYVRAFLGTTNVVSGTNYTAYSALNSASNNNVNGGFTASELYAMGFTAGQTVFIKLYGDSYQSNDYDDPATSKTVFPNLNPTSPAAVQFIVP
jgi:hypothetical protein